MAEKLDVEIETRPGKVVLRFARDGETAEYPLAAESATRLAENIEQAAKRAGPSP